MGASGQHDRTLRNGGASALQLTNDAVGVHGITFLHTFLCRNERLNNRLNALSSPKKEKKEHDGGSRRVFQGKEAASSKMPRATELATDQGQEGGQRQAAAGGHGGGLAPSDSGTSKRHSDVRNADSFMNVVRTRDISEKMLTFRA